jgi:hypothetical protein
MPRGVADLDRWQCRPPSTIDVIDLKDRPAGVLDSVVVDSNLSRSRIYANS